MFRRTICVLVVLVVGCSCRSWARTENVLETVAAIARENASMAGPVDWEQPIDFEAADLVEFLAPGRVLLGTVTLSAGGIPSHGPIMLIDSGTGERLWEAKRSGRSDGEYRLLAVDPLLILVGYDDDDFELIGLDPVSGKRQWRFRGSQPFSFQATAKTLFYLTGGKGEVRALDLATGKERWKGSSEEGANDLVLAGEFLVVIGKEIVGLATTDGEPRWTLTEPSLSRPMSTVLAGDGLIVWNRETALAIDETTGRVLWQRGEERKGLKAVDVIGDRVYRVLTDLRGDVVEALDGSNGELLWTAVLEDVVVSPLVLSGERLCLTTAHAVEGLNWADGTVAVRVEPPQAWSDVNPTTARVLGAPDVLVPWGDHLVVWRDRFGLLAVDLPEGVVAWTQPSYNPTPDYNANDAALLGITAVSSQRVGVAAGFPSVQEPGPNPFLVAAQRRHAAVMAQTSRTLDSTSATRADRQSAIQLRGMSSRLSAAQSRVSQSMEQMQTGVAAATSVMALGQAIKEARRQQMQEGLNQRYQMWSAAALRRRDRAFQGRYFLEPFLARGRGMGLTVVSLDTGRRSDFLYAPLVVPLVSYSLDLLAWALDEERNCLVGVGVTFEPDNFRPKTKWGWRMPHPSLFAFDLAKLTFASEVKRAAEVSSPAVAATRDGPTTELHAAATSGDAAAVTRLLESGSKIDATHVAGYSALHMAAMVGHAEVVRILIEHGADVNLKDAMGLDPLDYAKGGLQNEDTQQRREVLRLLQEVID